MLCSTSALAGPASTVVQLQSELALSYWKKFFLVYTCVIPSKVDDSER